MSTKADEGAGCFLIIAAFAIAVGGGMIWGEGLGWLAFGVLLLIFVLGSL